MKSWHRRSASCWRGTVLVIVVCVLLIAICSLLGFPAKALATQMPVVPWKQGNAAWSGVPLGISGHYTVGSAGCAVTSAAMVANYWGSSMNPGQFTQALQSNGGLVLDINDVDGRDGDIIWQNVSSSIVGGTIQFVDHIKWGDYNRLNAELDAGYPVVVNVPHTWQHWVVVTGRSGSTYYINDPIDGAQTTLDRYNNTVYQLVIYHGTRAPAVFNYWKGEYFSNMNLSGSPAAYHDDGQGTNPFLDLNWGQSAPIAGVPADYFSARWTRTLNFAGGNYRFHEQTDDGARLYIDGQLVLDDWIVEGFIDHTVDVNLAAGNHVIKLEYFDNRYEAAAKLWWEKLAVSPTITSLSPSSGSTLGGTSVTISGTGFDQGVTGVSIGGVDVFSSMVWLSATQLRVTAPAHTAGIARVQVTTVYGSTADTAADDFTYVAPPPTVFNYWKGEYYSNTGLSGTPVYRDDPIIDFNWAQNAPVAGVQADLFSVRWTRTLNFAAGTYRFHEQTDDGGRLYIDGQLVLDDWIVEGFVDHTVDVNLAAGNHVIKLEYFDNRYEAAAKLWWETLPPTSFSNWKGEYFANIGLSGSPTAYRDDSNISFDWGTGEPMPGIPADNFSVRWTRTLSFAQGTYRFYNQTDDGVRLYVDGKLVINKWVDQANVQNKADVDLSAGNHDVKMEYFEHAGSAVAKLWWEPLSPPTPNPDIDLKDVAFTDASSGWAVGAFGTILHTVDGGSTWASQDSGASAQLNAVSFASNKVGWAVGDRGTILHTVDAGVSWVPQGVEVTGVNLTGVAFIDTLTGWVIGGGWTGATILHTADGGLTWQEQFSGEKGFLNGISFASPTTGWVVGDKAEPVDHEGRTRGLSLIMRTTNGGATWTELSTGTFQTLYAVAFVNANRGWAAGGWVFDHNDMWESPGLLRTENGGLSWAGDKSLPIGHRYDPANGYRLQVAYTDVVFAGALNGWAAGSCADPVTVAKGKLYRTTDGGASWKDLDPAGWTYFGMSNFTFADANHGWAVGEGGLLLCTSDGGKTWNQQSFQDPNPGSLFPDISTSPYKSAIESLAGADIINGFDDGTFRPTNPVSRQQFAKMIVLALELPVSESDVCIFKDVTKGGSSTLYPDNYVAVAATRGITTGTSPTTFAPYANITRAQLITMIVRAAENLGTGSLTLPPQTWQGTLPSSDPTHGANTRKAEYNGLLTGITISGWSIWGNASRGEVAQMLSNLRDR